MDSGGRMICISILGFLLQGEQYNGKEGLSEGVYRGYESKPTHVAAALYKKPLYTYQWTMVIRSLYGDSCTYSNIGSPDHHMVTHVPIPILARIFRGVITKVRMTKGQKCRSNAKKKYFCAKYVYSGRQCYVMGLIKFKGDT